MNCITRGFSWALAILLVAFVAKANGVGESETFALTMGLTAAAMAHLRPSRRCGSV